MEVVIYTNDPESIDTDEIRRALERLDYFVDTVRVEVR